MSGNIFKSLLIVVTFLFGTDSVNDKVGLEDKTHTAFRRDDARRFLLFRHRYKSEKRGQPRLS